MIALAVQCVHGVYHAAITVHDRRVADVHEDLNPDEYYPLSKVRVVDVESVRDGSLPMGRCEACRRAEGVES